MANGSDASSDGPTAEFWLNPNIRVYGEIKEETVHDFLRQLDKLLKSKDAAVLELSTTGGDADAGRRIAEEIRLLRVHRGRDAYFIGKSFVMSAGVTIMSAFPCAKRALTVGATLMIHERHMSKTLEMQGPLRAEKQRVQEVLSQIEHSCNVEKSGFESLTRDSKISADEMYERALTNYYLTAEEALELGLVCRIL